MLALAGLLGDAAAPARGKGGLRQLTAQLSTMLASISSRIAALVPERLAPDAAAPGAADQPTAPLLEPDPSLLVVRQPPPPPIGPILSLDPETGMIVDPLDGHGGDGAGGDASGGEAGSSDDPAFTLPSSWVPVASGVLARVRRRIGALADRIDALLAEVGMTRLQLLLLMLLGPAAVAFLIDVAVSIAQGR